MRAPSRLLSLTLWTLAAALGVAGGCGEIFVPGGPDTGDAGATDTGPGDNRAPVFSDPGAQSAVENLNFTLKLTATDPDEALGQTVTVSMTDGSQAPGATFDPGTNTFRWKPAVGTAPCRDVKSVQVTFAATDDATPPRSTPLTVTVEVAANGDGDDTPDSADDDLDGDGLTNAEEDAGATDACKADSDDDGVKDGQDNCPVTANDLQVDDDLDGAGNACDPCPKDPKDDEDLDAVCGDLDNCPTVLNADQADADSDGLGDACDACDNDPNNDADEDTICGDVDNCPTVSNQDQANADGDALGDACDSCDLDPNDDEDNDGKCADVDNCPDVKNDAQLDGDQDGIGDACDTCPGKPGTDVDNDTVCEDNCPEDPNLDQADADSDGVGDVCDACPNDPDNDSDGDTLCAGDDNCPDTANLGQEDGDGDGIGDACDACPADEDNDIDGDTVCGDVDNCPAIANTDQANSDGAADGGDACDDDDDDDGLLDTADNCPTVANLDQSNVDGDALGDACDDDIDGDGVLNAADLCPTVADPAQLDVDNDGVGLACDPFIAVDPGVLPAGTVQIAGHAFGGTVGLALYVAGVSTSVIAVERGEHYTALANWRNLNPTGTVATPKVGMDEVSYFSATDNLGASWLDRVVGGAITPVSAAALPALPKLSLEPSGGVVAEATIGGTAGLYRLLGTSPAAQVVAATTFVDSGGKGPVRGPDGSLYYPVQVGAQLSLKGFGPSGLASPDPISGQSQLYYLATGPSGRPWYCWKAAGAPRVGFLVGGGVSASIALTNALDCTQVQLTIDGGKDVAWLIYTTSGNQAGEVLRWPATGASTVVFAGGALTGPTVHVAGPQTYITAACTGAGCVSVYRDTGAANPPLLDQFTMYFTKVATNGAGWLGIAGRDVAGGTATGDVVAMLVPPTGAPLVANVTASPVAGRLVQEAWVTHNGVLWIRHQYSSGTQRRLATLHGGTSGPATTAELFDLNTSASVSSYDVPGLSSYAVVSVDGAGSGIYLASVNGDAVTVTSIGSAIANHAKFIPTSDGSYAGAGWLSYQETPGNFVLAKLAPGSPDPVLTVERSGMTQPPLFVYQAPGGGAPWFGYEMADATRSIATIAADGTFTDWLTGKSVLFALTYGEDTSLLWGVRKQDTLASPRQVCQLPPANVCWTFPVGDYSLTWGPFVTAGDNVYAATTDNNGGAIHIWRNVDAPTPAQ